MSGSNFVLWFQKPPSLPPASIIPRSLFGKLADIVVWNSNPLADITVLQRLDEISAVIKDGRLVDRGAGGFRQLLEEPSRARMLAQG
jgi:hypothetical protein